MPMGKVRFISAGGSQFGAHPRSRGPSKHVGHIDMAPWHAWTGVVDLRTGDMKQGRQSDHIRRVRGARWSAPGKMHRARSPFKCVTVDTVVYFSSALAIVCQADVWRQGSWRWHFGAAATAKALTSARSPQSWDTTRSRNRWRRSPSGPGCQGILRRTMAGARLNCL